MEVSHQKSCANLALLNRRPCEAMEPSFLAPAPQVRPGTSQRLPLCSCARSPVLHLAGVDLPSPLSSGRHPGRRLSPLMDVVAQVLSLLPSTCLTASLYRTPLSIRATDSTRHRHSAEPLPLPHRHSARRWFLLRFPFPLLGFLPFVPLGQRARMCCLPPFVAMMAILVATGWSPRRCHPYSKSSLFEACWSLFHAVPNSSDSAQLAPMAHQSCLISVGWSSLALFRVDP